MDFFEVVKARKSSRKYKEAKVDRVVIEKILDAGRMAPSAYGTQPWHFVVVEDRVRLKAIADITDYGKFIKDASACIIVYAEEDKYYLENGCAAVENVLLAAAALELGTCWVAGDKKKYVDVIDKLVNASDKMKLIALISLGVSAEKSTNKKIKSLDKLIHWENF